MALTAGMVGGIIQGVGGLAQMASGIFGKNKRQKRLENLLAQRPTYQIPQEIKQDMEMSRNQVNARLNEQQDMKNSLMSQQATQVNMARQASGSLEDMLAVGAASAAGTEEALIKNRIAGSTEKDKRLERYREAMTNLAQAKDQAFKINELDPFNMRLQGTLANDAASRQMTFGGLNQLGAGLANAGTAGVYAGASGFFGEA